MHNIRNKKGITLIALILTIIVLLILAGVSIAMLSGDNSILRKAVEAKNSTEQSQIEETINLAYVAVIADQEEGDFKSLLEEEIRKEYADAKVEEKNGKYIITINGKDYTVNGNSNNKVLPSGIGTTPYLPSADYELDTSTSLETGLVMHDRSGNEYVWVEVPNNYDETTSKWTGPDYTSAKTTTKGSIEYYTEIANALKKYVGDYSKGSSKQSCNWKDEYYDGCGLTSEEYETLYKAMLDRVYKNGGFWIGRYEVGDATITTNVENGTSTAGKTSRNGTTNTAVIKKNQVPYNYVYCSDAEEIAERFAKTGNSSLLFGIQWDLTMEFIETKGKATYADLATNSKDLGNYKDNLWNITNVNSKASVNNGANWTKGAYGSKGTEPKAILLSTGADESFAKMNIYDLAGNVWEWTLEHATSNSYGPCAYRGGSYYNTGSDFPSSNRCYYRTTDSYYDVGLRVTLY